MLCTFHDALVLNLKKIISFCGVPNSRNVLIYKSFWNMLQSQTLETPQLGFRELNGRKSCWTWPGSAPKPPRPSPAPCSDLALHQSHPNPDLLRNLLLNLTWLCTKAIQAQTFSGTFFGTLLNLTWLCTKASQAQTFWSSSEPCWTWPGFAPKPPRPRPSEPLWNPVEPDLALHQSLPDLLRNLLRNPVDSPEPFPEACWTWPGSAPKPSRPSPEPSVEPSPEPDGPIERDLGSGTFSGTLLNLTWLCTEAFQTFSGTFCGTFSGTRWPYWTWPGSGTFSRTLLHLTWLCTKASQTFSGTLSGTLLNGEGKSLRTTP